MKFIGKIWKTGNTFVTTVPSAFVKFGQLEEGKEYQIHFKNLESIEDVEENVNDLLKNGKSIEDVEENVNENKK